MAVSPMFKVAILAHASVTDDVIAALQRAEALQIVVSGYDLPPVEIAPDDERLRRVDEQLADAAFVCDLLGRHHKPDHAFKMFVAEKFHLGYERYLQLDFDTHAKRLYRESVALADQLAHAEREIIRLRHLVADLQPWVDLRLQISQWLCSQDNTLMTGTVAAPEAKQLRQELRELTPLATVEEVSGDFARQAWVVIAHNSVAADVRVMLASRGFSEVGFPDLADYPAEELARAEEQITEYEAAVVRVNERLEVLAEENYADFVVLMQALHSERDRLLVRADFGSTECTVTIGGWVAQDRADTLRAALKPWATEIDLALAEPTAEDEPPVLLRNPRWLKPLEVITDLYGRPRYGEIDPTPLIAPFFLAFFGICIGDVGYGLMLIVGSWLIKTKVDVAPGVKRFLELMMLGGLTAMGFGVAFGSYLALPVEMLPRFLANLQLLDPLNELTTFLLFTLVLGIIQVFFGVLVAAYNAFRRGDPQEAIFGQLSTIYMFAMIAAFVLTGQGLLLSLALIGTMLMQGRAIQGALGDSSRTLVDRGLGWIWLAVVIGSTVPIGTGHVMLGLGMIVGASALAGLSKSARGGLLGLLGGIYAVYGMTSFVGDTLSYTRLAALGLSGSLVGFVFNVLAGLVWEPAATMFQAGGFSLLLGAVVAVMAALIFVVGHVFNVVINLLGAFVHPARLQFVEFFSKFYEAGGVEYKPFAVRSENLVLEAGSAGSEGGAG